MSAADLRSLPTTPAISIALPAGAVTVVAPLPAFVSQKTSMAVLGIPPDRFLAMVRAPGFPLRVASVGKLRIVKTEDVIAYLDRIGETPSALGNKEATSNDNAEPPIENEDDAARKLGSALGFTFSDDPPASGRRRKG